mmetsp:Transcript_13749/g.39845  ORF Transcript_13749/g.39845 Transcript_13749/m.39845 type:complete len:96 (-) Transcript_13749:311-598(-)
MCAEALLTLPPFSCTRKAESCTSSNTRSLPPLSCNRKAESCTTANTHCPCSGLQGKTNFFERRVGEYQKSGVMARAGGADSKPAQQHVFSTEEDF